MGRIKELSRKPARTRKRNPVVYLICEGSETEIRYFKRFRSRGCNIDIIPISSQYKSADRLVQKAKATMGNNPYYPDEGDSIWCVFDRDDNSNEVLLRAKQSAQKEGYHLAYSNPSFELWFLLHFVNQQTEVEDCQALPLRITPSILPFLQSTVTQVAETPHFRAISFVVRNIFSTRLTSIHTGLFYFRILSIYNNAFIFHLAQFP